MSPGTRKHLQQKERKKAKLKKSIKQMTRNGKGNKHFLLFVMKYFVRKQFLIVLLQSFMYFRYAASYEADGQWENHVLTIKDAVLEDAGDYEVVASNRIGNTEMVGKLSIVTEPPTFPTPLADVTTKLGCTESFSAVVAGTPKPEVGWQRDGKELKKGKRVLLEEESVPGGTMYKATVRDIVMKDFGLVSNEKFTI